MASREAIVLILVIYYDAKHQKDLHMFTLPKSTEFNKRIPKQKFYENIAVTPAMKK